MKPLSLNLSKMKKIGGDKHSSTFMHPSGHHMVIAHSGVSALQRKQLEQMPIQKLAEGTPDGPVEPMHDQDAGPQPSVPPMDPAGTEQNPGPTEPQSPEESAPAPEAPAQPPAAVPGPGYAEAYQQGQRGISEQQSVDTAKSQANVGIQEKELTDRQKLQNEFTTQLQGFTQHHQRLMADYAAGHIDPKHYTENMTSGQKVATAIGLFLGGFSTPFTHQGNPAMDFLNKQIDRDIASQQEGLDQKKTLLGANQALFHDQLLAQQQTRIAMNDIYDHKIQLEAAKLGTPQAKANADMAHAKFAMENVSLLQQSAMRAAALKGGGGQDPARLVPFLVPKEHQAKAFSEIDAAENTQRMSKSILSAFEDAAKENTAMKTGFGTLRTPGSVYALHQAMQPTFKDLEGTVRQAAMENTFKNITPMPGDTEHKIQQKRQALQGYIQSKLSAPTARGYGIDLSKFGSTRALSPGEGQTATMGGVQYVKVPGGWKRAQ